jgi:predicted Na+-dependent transporter
MEQESMTLVNWLLAGGISLAMMYTGLLFDPAWANPGFIRNKVRPFAGLALVNYLAVPFLAVIVVAILPVNPTLTLALLTLSVLPCAPLVPALVTLAAEPPEWPLAVFLGFSAFSFLVVLILVVYLKNFTRYAADIGADVGSKLLLYVLMVYGPMALGALWRFWSPASALRLLGPVRALTGIITVVMLTLFATVHRGDFANVGSVDLLLILGFVLLCGLLGAITTQRFAGPRLTAMISTSFRNIALGIAFTTVVLRRPDVTAYLVIYSGVTLLVCGVLLTVRKSAARWAVSD